MGVDATWLSRSYQLSASFDAVSISTSNKNQSPFISLLLVYEISEMMRIKLYRTFEWLRSSIPAKKIEEVRDLRHTPRDSCCILVLLKSCLVHGWQTGMLSATFIQVGLQVGARRRIEKFVGVRSEFRNIE